MILCKVFPYQSQGRLLETIKPYIQTIDFDKAPEETSNLRNPSNPTQSLGTPTHLFVYIPSHIDLHTVLFLQLHPNPKLNLATCHHLQK